MPPSHKNPTSQLRIIGGQWRGRKLHFPSLPGLRPTGDRIRETLFNWLQADIVGARCLDVFAGSGALGFEAVSRGAQSALLLEQHPLACQHLNAHVALLKTTSVEVRAMDALAFLQQAPVQAFNGVFLDPPFAHNLWQPVVDALLARPWLAPGAWIYVESGPQLVLNTPPHWQLHRQKMAGSVQYRLYVTG